MTYTIDQKGIHCWSYWIGKEITTSKNEEFSEKGQHPGKLNPIARMPIPSNRQKEKRNSDQPKGA